jgi:hypothetical protein
MVSTAVALGLETRKKDREGELGFDGCLTKR